MPLRVLPTPPSSLPRPRCSHLCSCSLPTALVLTTHRTRAHCPPPSCSLPAAPVLAVRRPSPLHSLPTDLVFIACRPQGSLAATLALTTRTVVLAACRPYAHCWLPPAFTARCLLPAALALAARCPRARCPHPRAALMLIIRTPCLLSCPQY
ncbi:hypothetical protein DFH08DRAFT_977614 [Mycena albidolilacea]|uniref:Uncharacterized protein n=1 Tax=Mycena albidolilacea TaxID=1033008 RepID=A0AAD6Z0J8_9AGAR|nr:hypothetical protein DFH08DRAFT_977614 [Mycena albidolilacea]